MAPSHDFGMLAQFTSNEIQPKSDPNSRRRAVVPNLIFEKCILEELLLTLRLLLKIDHLAMNLEVNGGQQRPPFHEPPTALGFMVPMRVQNWRSRLSRNNPYNNKETHE